MMQGRTNVKLLLMFQLLARTVTLTLFRLQLDVSHNTYFYSFPWIVHVYILFTIMVLTMSNTDECRWVVRFRKLPAYRVSWTNL